MIHGLDTGFLVAAEVVEHTSHVDARAILARLVAAGDSFAITPQVLAEFIHVVSDSRRFSQPLSVADAIRLADEWWTARDVTMIFPDDGATRQFLGWLREHSLGRKRLLDTLLAATYRQAGISSILTTNPSDFATFGGLTCVVPTSVAPA